MTSKKILIVHGWLHSAERYKKLKEDIEKNSPYHITLYEFPGFGNSPAQKKFNILNSYVQDVEKELTNGAYDFAIGHSMGGNILLRAMTGKKMPTKLILLSPEYNGITLLKPLILLTPVIPLVLSVLKKFSCNITTFLIQCMALFTINTWKCIDNQIVADTRKASTTVTTVTMLELAWDNWRIKKKQWHCGKVTLIIGENDRIISRKKMRRLYHDLGGCTVYQINGIGHTAVLEAYDKLLNLLLKILNECKRTGRI